MLLIYHIPNIVLSGLHEYWFIFLTTSLGNMYSNIIIIIPIVHMRKLRQNS